MLCFIYTGKTCSHPPAEQPHWMTMINRNVFLINVAIYWPLCAIKKLNKSLMLSLSPDTQELVVQHHLSWHIPGGRKKEEAVKRPRMHTHTLKIIIKHQQRLYLLHVNNYTQKTLVHFMCMYSGERCNSIFLLWKWHFLVVFLFLIFTSNPLHWSLTVVVSPCITETSQI